MIKLSISNIAWPAEADDEMYCNLNKMGFTGLEIAPSRLFGPQPYEECNQAAEWARLLDRQYHLSIPSMQSIWFGRSENLFRSEEERRRLVRYTMEALKFAEAISCKNLVFGCPKNRNVTESVHDAAETARSFFSYLGKAAHKSGVQFGIEANPPIYHTNYLNTTGEVLQLLKEINTPGLGINLDLGAMIQNGESIENIQTMVPFISHVHISEPGLGKIKRRAVHKELFQLLSQEEYDKYVSIEMGNQESITDVLRVMDYIREVSINVES